MSIIYSNWRLLSILGLSLAFFIWIAAPGLTWVNTNSDSSTYLAAAKFFIPSHPTGAPAFNLLNAGFLRAFPFGNEAWRLALLSAIFAGITSGILYHHTRSIIAPLVYMASGLVASQASIIETYSLITLLMVSMYVWRSHTWVIAVTAIIGLGIHHLIGLTLLPVLIWHYSEWRNGLTDKYEATTLQVATDTNTALWSVQRMYERPRLNVLTYLVANKVLLTIPLGALWYIWLPLTFWSESIWVRENSFSAWRDYMSGQAGLTGGLSLLQDNWEISSDLLIRVSDVFFIVVGGFLAALVPIAMRARNDLLTWVFILPLLHYAAGLPHVAYVYMMPAFAFGGIMAAEWLRDRPRWYLHIVGATAAIVIVFNVFAYDIGGEVLDPDATATEFYNALDSLPDDAVVWTYDRGWEWTTIILYNLETGREIVHPVIARQSLEEVWPIITEAERDERLYHTQVTHPTTYRSRLEQTKVSVIWTDLVRQYYWPKKPPDESQFISIGN